MQETVVERKYKIDCSARRCCGLQEYEAVGVSAARKLQRMDSKQAILAESLINYVLKCGLMKRLTEHTEIYEKMSVEKATDTDSIDEGITWVCDPDCEGRISSDNQDDTTRQATTNQSSKLLSDDTLNENGNSHIMIESISNIITNVDTNMDTNIESNPEITEGEDSLSSTSSIAELSVDVSKTNNTKSNPIPPKPPKTMSEGGVLSAQLTGNRIVNLQYIFNAFNILINHSTSPDCRNNMTFGHESMNGLVSTISFPCSGCRQVYYLDTQPQDSNINVRWLNCSAALGIETCKLSSIFKYFDIPITDNDMKIINGGSK